MQPRERVSPTRTVPTPTTGSGLAKRSAKAALSATNLVDAPSDAHLRSCRRRWGCGTCVRSREGGGGGCMLRLNERLLQGEGEGSCC